MCHESLNLNHGKDAEFYDNWYASGYMDEWPADKKERIFEIITALNLPETGEALDYGCGNGVFTEVIKKALPRWNVFGCDISSVAIDNARNRYSDCTFFVPSDNNPINRKFDFLLSHHVLEHVSNIADSWKDINQYVKKNASLLIILPCGNQGSFEHRMCMLKKDGIDYNSGGRFFFEDKSHLRRLTTKQMNDFAILYGFTLADDYYSSQFYGAINWITSSSISFIINSTRIEKTIDTIAALEMMGLRLLLSLLKILRFPANTIDYKKQLMSRGKYYFLSVALLMFYPLSKITNFYLQHKSDLEWKNDRNKKNGSEMYLYYER